MTLNRLVLNLAFYAMTSPTIARAQEPVEQISKSSSSPSVEIKRAENLPNDINRSFLDVEMNPEEYVKRFEVESREVFVQRSKIVEALQIQQGMAIADIGSGTGLFLKPLSKAVGDNGKVLAVEISPSFVRHLKERIKSERLLNAQVVLCSDRDANLPLNSVDRLLVCDVYHHFEYPESTLGSLHSALRPGGLLVVVDFYREPDVNPERLEWLRGHIRAPMEVFRQEIEQAGFRFLDQVEVDGFKENYLIRFTKSE